VKARDLRAAGIVALVIAGLYLPGIFSGRAVVEDPTLIDVSFLIQPNVTWAARSWQAGLFPLWNPHTHCGMPHLGYSHCGGLYPPQVMLLAALPYAWAASVNIVIHVMLAGVLFYFLMRFYRVAPFMAGAAGLCFALSGFFFGMTYATQMLGSTCAWVAIWTCLHRFVRRPRPLTLLGGALAVAWCGLGGDVELLTYGLLAVALSLLFTAGWSIRQWIARGASSAFPVILGFLLMAPVAFTVMETVRFSIRGPLMPFPLEMPNLGRDWFLMVPALLAPIRGFQSLAPQLAFNSGLPPIYCGFLFPGLFLGALLYSRRNKDFRPAAALCLIMLIFPFLIEAESTGRFFKLVPIIRSLKVSYKAFLIFQVMALMLVFRILADYKTRTGPASPALGALLIGAGAFMAATAPWCLGGPERIGLGILAVLAGGAAIIARQGRPLLGRSAAVNAAVALMAMEAVALAYRCHPRTDPARFDLDPKLTAIGQSLPPGGRFAIFEPLLTTDPNSAPPLFGLFELASGANNPLGGSRVMPARIFVYLSSIYRQMIKEDPPGKKQLDLWSMTNPGTLDRGRMHLFNLAGVNLVLARDEPVPYSSPYSLLSAQALSWQAAAPSDRAAMPGEGSTVTGPGAMTARAASQPGDRLEVKASPAGEGWLLIHARRDRPGTDALLIARFGRPGERLDLAAGMEALTGGGTLTLGLAPKALGACRLRLEALDKINPGLSIQKFARVAGVDLFTNRDALPRAFIVHSPVVAPDRNQVLNLMVDPARFNPARQVVLEKETMPARDLAGQVPLSEAARRAEQVRIVSYGPQRVEMSADLVEPGYLVFTDTYFPGWRAEVWSDGLARPQRIIPADLAFRALLLAEGQHRITFLYQPASFRLGLWVGATTLLLLLAVGAMAITTRVRAAGEKEPFLVGGR
jgi:hypothetical protein